MKGRRERERKREQESVPELRVAAEGVDAHQVVVALEPRQLEEVGEGGAHVAAVGFLAVLAALEVREVARGPLLRSRA